MRYSCVVLVLVFLSGCLGDSSSQEHLGIQRRILQGNEDESRSSESRSTGNVDVREPEKRDQDGHGPQNSKKCEPAILCCACSNTNGGVLLHCQPPCPVGFETTIPKKTKTLNVQGITTFKLNSFLLNRMNHVEKLILDATNTTQLNFSVFSPLTKLKVLSLKRNYITGLPTTPKGFRSLEKLEELYLDDNLITTVDFSVFAPLTKLRVLSLGKNRIHTITSTSDTKPVLEKLTTLNLENNNITSIDSKAFARRMPMLKNLIVDTCNCSWQEFRVMWNNGKRHNARKTPCDRDKPGVRSSCKGTPNIVKELGSILDTEITAENAMEISNSVSAVSEKSSEFNEKDIDITLRIVEDLFRISIDSEDKEIINNTVVVLGNMFHVPKESLIGAQREFKSAERYLDAINDFVGHVSLKKSNIEAIHPNLAIVVLSLDQGSNNNITLSADRDLSNSGALFLEDNGTDREVKNVSKDIIYLPDTLFTNIRNQGLQGGNRASFVLYHNDTFFQISDNRTWFRAKCVASQKQKKYTVYAAMNRFTGDCLAGRCDCPQGLPGNCSHVSGLLLALEFIHRTREQVIKDSRAQSTIVGDQSPEFNSPSGKEEQVNSRVLSVSIGNLTIKNLQDPVLLTFVHREQNSSRPQCVFWDVGAGDGAGDWSGKGCRVRESVNGSHTVCECDHLTNFALLMDVYGSGNPGSTQQARVLSIISVIGCAISFCGLLLTIIVYWLVGNLRRDTPSKLLLNLCVALACVNLTFIIGIFALDNPQLCKAIAVLMHYFVLSSMAWMSVEAFYIYMALVIVFRTYFRRFMLKTMLICWGVPLVVVAITLGVNRTDNYGPQAGGNICWLNRTAFYVAFLAPVALVLIGNSIIFILVIRQICGMSSKKLNKSERASATQQLRGIIGVFILLGLSWVFAIFAIGEASVALQYLFTIFNSFQGLFIFIFYCLMKKDVQKKLFCCDSEAFPWSSSQKSTPGTYNTTGSTKVGLTSGL